MVALVLDLTCCSRSEICGIIVNWVSMYLLHSMVLVVHSTMRLLFKNTKGGGERGCYQKEKQL